MSATVTEFRLSGGQDKARDASPLVPPKPTAFELSRLGGGELDSASDSKQESHASDEGINVG
eukprot:CAMPEP_0119152366 /NCGR_PEP_ID=MMETSP1310-20130426/47703_1 /TAXON_ID=464262 /ORGANISM="Genus nov. species nov., Strain RCC2339" /LENGTH=61 /DNA_ID=CAMNT_0007144721 /DNA_START=54 /DNA_END=236 /DNA_ORIENTATION=+